MKISIVATLYQSSPHIKEFYERTTLVAQELVGAADYEIVFVNDGSPDDSLDLAIRISEQDSHVVVVDLSRNFGHHKAMMTGLSHSKGEYVFLIDSDLEEEPEYLIEFFKNLENNKCDVVYGVQDSRKGGLVERYSGKWFYLFINAFTGLTLPENVVTARLMTRRYVDSLLEHREREVFLAGLWHITGFEQFPYMVKKHSSSATTYTFRKRISVMVNSITSFSNTPLILIFYIGLLIMLIAFVGILYLVANKMLFAKPVSGWTSVMASIWLLGGMIISFIGVVGIYLSKIFSKLNSVLILSCEKYMEKEILEIHKEVANYYTRKIETFGETPRGVDWNSKESQELRFLQLCKIITNRAGFSLNDLGCGYGALSFSAKAGVSRVFLSRS